MLGAIADGLGLPASQVRPAYEDALSRLANAVRQPAGEPVAADDDLEADAADRRAALLARLDESVTEPAAYVLPLHRRDDDSGWASADWQLRRGRIVLLEGDSPAGSAAAAGLDQLASAARVASRPTRWRAAAACAERSPTPSDAESRTPTPRPPPRWSPRSATGCCYVFLPPTEELEHFVDLVARVRGRGGQGRLPAGDRGLRPAAGSADRRR